MQFSLLQANLCYAYERILYHIISMQNIPILNMFYFFPFLNKNFVEEVNEILGTKSSALCHTVLLFCHFRNLGMTQTERIAFPILDVQCSVFHKGDKNVLTMADI